MAFVEIDQPFLSDLLVKEREDYYSRAEGIVSIAAGETSPTRHLYSSVLKVLTLLQLGLR